MKDKPVAGISLLQLKVSREPPRSTSPPDGPIVINNTYAFILHALRTGFNPDILVPETSDCGYALLSLLIPTLGGHLKSTPGRGSNTRLLLARR